MTRFLPRIVLMLGNIAVGLAVLAPAGMLAELAQDLRVEVHAAGMLVTYGAIVLCVSSPVGAWLTSRIDRRLLLATIAGLIALSELATAFAPNYATVLALRIAMLAATALYTPQAAATVALIVPEKERPGAIAFVFLGWSMAIAAGLPLVTFITTHLGWRATYGILAAVAVGLCLFMLAVLPRGLRGKPLSLSSFADIARNATIVFILLVTLLTTSGQFSVVVYLAPILEKLTGQGPSTAALLFATMGSLGLVGNVIATSVVQRVGVHRTLAFFLSSLSFGLVLWALGAGNLPVMAAGIVFLGLGFAASNSMQQARLAAAAPDVASASIALNTSILYVGQAIGSGVGGFFYATGQYAGAGYAAAAFSLTSLAVLALTWKRR